MEKKSDTGTKESVQRFYLFWLGRDPKCFKKRDLGRGDFDPGDCGTFY